MHEHRDLSRFGLVFGAFAAVAGALAARVTKSRVKCESGCRKPRDRGLRDVEAPRYIGLRVSVSKAPKGF